MHAVQSAMAKLARLSGALATAALAALSMQSGASAQGYDYPLINPYAATVVGTPPVYRAELPEWVPKQAPCMHACPNQNDVRGAMVAVAQREKYGMELDQACETAYAKIAQTNPLMATCGRVCPHPCEEALWRC